MNASKLRSPLWAGLVAMVHAIATQSPAVANEPAAVPHSQAEAENVVTVEFRQAGIEHAVSGRILEQSLDGGLLLQGEDGVLWTIEGRQIVSRKPADMAFEPLSQDQLADRMLAELPPDFRVHITPHYVVCYNTSRAYARWTSSLLERLHKAFTAYWEKQGIELREPEFPLGVVVFDDRRMYDLASRADLPNGTGVLSGAGGIVGYYSLRSNRINMFDLTGFEALRTDDNQRGSLRQINQMLSQPGAVPLVATIVHEATHQIAFNCGLLQRYADLPFWLCEGMAVYFEAPDLSSSRGWRGIGKVNYSRLGKFRENLPNWRSDTLERLIASDDRFRNSNTAIDAYADAWALNYYLIRYRSDAYASYLKQLAKKRPLMRYNAETRLEEFRQHFGDLEQLQQDFLRQMMRVD